MHSTDSSDRVNTIFIFLNRLTRICAKDGKLISFDTETTPNTLVYHEYWALHHPISLGDFLFQVLLIKAINHHQVLTEQKQDLDHIKFTHKIEIEKKQAIEPAF